MTMEKEKWVKAIKEELEEMADKELQERLWISGDSYEISSYVELMCRLFDDKRFPEFIAKGKSIGLTETIIDKLSKLEEALDGYKEKKTDIEIINDPKWDVIRNMAKEVLILM
jgi:Rod binding domain-containing protein